MRVIISSVLLLGKLKKKVHLIKIQRENGVKLFQFISTSLAIPKMDEKIPVLRLLTIPRQW